MYRLALNKDQFSDLINLKNGVFSPLDHFVNESDFKNILYKKKYNGKFFPIPIFFGISIQKYQKIKKLTALELIYKGKLLGSIMIKSIFRIDHKEFGKNLFGNNYRIHPYYKQT